MRGTAELTTPGETEVTLSITAKLSEWEALRKRLGQDWPEWKFGQTIGSLIGLMMEGMRGKAEFDQ